MRILLSLLVSIVVLFPASFLRAEEVGYVVAIKGKVVIKRNAMIKVALNDKIFLNDLIATGDLSRLKILFKDDSLLTLKANSRVHIKEFLHAEKGERGKSIITLSDGALRALKGTNDFEVHTLTAVAAARGTFFYVETMMAESIPVTVIAVLEGIVDVYNIDSLVTGMVTLTRGTMTKVSQGQPPLQPFDISPEMLHKLLDCPPNK